MVGRSERADDAGRPLPLFTPGEDGVPKPTGTPQAISKRGVPYETVTKVILYDTHEPWFRGDPEVALQIRAPRNVLFYDGDFPGVNDTRVGYAVDRRTSHWLKQAFLAYLWYERDGGAAVTVDVGVPLRGAKANVKFTLRDGDDRLGAVGVPRAYRGTATSYDTGDVAFWRTQKRWR